MRGLSIAIVLATALSASPAPAQIDLTGAWTVTITDVFLGPQVLRAQLTQSGTDLTWAFDDGFGGAVGTFDGTSVLNVQGASYGGVFGIVPGIVIDALVEDANHFAGTYTYSFTKITPPPCIPYCRITDPLTAVRESHVCGDGLQGPGEACDAGAANGSDGCCNVDCTLVDPDFDGVCSAHDDCPDVYDEAQDDICHAGVVNLRRVTVRPPSVAGGSDGVVRLRGTLSGRGAPFEDIDTFLFTAGTLGTNATAPPCQVVGTGRTVCRTADRTIQLVGRLLPGGTTIRFRARFPLNFGSPPAAGPVGLLVRNAPADILWGGVASTCRTSSAGVLRCRTP